MGNTNLRTKENVDEKQKQVEANDPMLVYLRNRPPTVLDSEKVSGESDQHIIIPPLNTDIRFGPSLSLAVMPLVGDDSSAGDKLL